MAIEKLNFSGINSGSKDFDTPLGSVADRFMKYGAMLNEQDAEKAKQERINEQDAYQKQRDIVADTRFNDQQAKIDAEKNRLISKDINTANAMQSVYNPDEYKAGRLSVEQKAIDDSIANLSPDEQIVARSEVAKSYDPKASGQQWVDTALSQSNVDSSKIADLRMDIDKQRIQQEQFAENKRLQERANAISAQTRADNLKLKQRELDIQEGKLKAPTKEDVKAAQEREGLRDLFKQNQIKWESNLTNKQLEDRLKSYQKTISEKKEKDQEAREKGILLPDEKKDIKTKRIDYLSSKLEGSDGSTFNNIKEDISKNQSDIDKFLLRANMKLGKNYSDTMVLDMLANARRSQSISAPWDSRFQDAIEAVSEDLGISEDDY